jgi:hypothetical protein
MDKDVVVVVVVGPSASVRAWAPTPARDVTHGRIV